MASNGFVFDHVVDEYNRETDRYSRLRARVSFVSGFILLLGTGISTLLSTYLLSFDHYSPRDAVFVIGITFSICFFVLATYFLLRCVVPVFKFANVESADVTWENFLKWEKYADNPLVIPKPDIDKLFKDRLGDQFAKAAASNRKTTEDRSILLQRATLSALLSALIMIAPATCKVLKSYDKVDAAPVKIEVTQPLKIQISK